MDIMIPIASITVLFFLLLLVKRFFDICVICAAVSLTWVSLLILYKFGMFDNPIIVALLIGQSIVGLYYLVDSRINKKLKMFRLPFLLTLTITGIFLLDLPGDIIPVIIFTSAVWAMFVLVYLFRSGKNMKKFIDKLIECCKNW